ncbi:MAG: GNAT family protein [Clostridia bacterium]|nr:GNAT family protein [Clostridia bacterium]
MKYFKKLVGEKVYLSPRNVEDYECFTEWLNDFETTDYIGKSNHLVTLASEKEYLEKHLNDEGTFYIVELDNDKLLGTIGIEEIDYIRRTGTLGIFIGDKEARSKGYGSEAIMLILDYAFHYLNLHNIKLDVFEFNKRALACYQKCGFQECGKRREAYFLNGKYYDVISMDILKAEFSGDYIKNKNV